jgi:hypothetical protein
METTMNSNVEMNVPAEPVRPSFLKVLCILTWIMCGITFISTVYNVVFEKSAEEKMQQIENMREINAEAADKMEAALAAQEGPYQTVNMILSLIAVGLSAYGAVMMWRLQRRGIFLYAAGELIPYIGFAFGGYEAIQASGSMTPFGESFGMIMIGIMIFFDFLFIAFYAMNLKHMR